MQECKCQRRSAGVDGECIFCEYPKVDQFCEYCNDLHPHLNFGKDFSGIDTLICADRLNDTLYDLRESK